MNCLDHPAAVETERRAKQAETQAAAWANSTDDEPDAECNTPMAQLIEPYPPKNTRSTEAKTAAMFQTNRTYVNQAAKLKQSAPETFEKVRSGMTTMTQANREIKEAKREERREENRAKVADLKDDMHAALLAGFQAGVKEI